MRSLLSGLGLPALLLLCQTLASADIPVDPPRPPEPVDVDDVVDEMSTTAMVAGGLLISAAVLATVLVLRKRQS